MTEERRREMPQRVRALRVAQIFSGPENEVIVSCVLSGVFIFAASRCGGTGAAGAWPGINLRDRARELFLWH